MSKKICLLCVVLPTFFAGLLHAGLASRAHVSIPPEFLFFIVIGVAQMFVAWWMWCGSKVAYVFGVLLHGSLTVMWILTRVLPAPFLSAPEHAGVLDVSIALMQVFAIFSIVRCAMFDRKRIFLLIMSSLFAGIVMYGSAVGVAHYIFPDIDVSDHHHASKSEDVVHKESAKDVEDEIHEDVDDHGHE